MFDDPKEELRRLEAQLLAMEPDEEAEEDFPEDPNEDWDSGLMPGENPAVDFGRTVYADEDYDDIYAAEPVSRRELKKAKKQEKIRRKNEKKERKKKRKRFFHRLLITIVKITVIYILIRWCAQWLT